MKDVEAKITRFQAIVRGRIARKKYRKLGTKLLICEETVEM